MRLFIIGLASAMFAVSLVAFTLSFVACEAVSTNQSDVPVLIDVLDVVDPQDAVEDGTGDVLEDAIESDVVEDMVQAASLSRFGNVELIVFNSDGAVVYSRVWEKI